MSHKYPRSPCQVRRLGIFLWIQLAALNVCAFAHEGRPVYIEISEIASHRYQLQWKIPPSVPASNTPNVALSKDCEAQSPVAQLSGSDGLIRRISYHCARSLDHQAITITYPGPNPSVSTLVRYSTISGERHVAVLGPEETSWTVPQAETASNVAGQYALLGIKHILAGVDHLLFLACLLWIAGTWRRVLYTITGFTLAHSATLILSALHLVRMPMPPVEASIALSLVFLATEIVRGPRQDLTWQYPIAVSSSFGLLHGLGFAAALREIGLPQTELMTGLLFFNSGVEIGQVLFVAGMIASLRLAQRFGVQWRMKVHQVALPRIAVGYAVGALATFWLIERCAAFWRTVS